MFTLHPEQIGKCGGSDERRQRLPSKGRCLRIHAHPFEFDHSAQNGAIDHKGQDYAQGYAEEREHCVGEPRQARDIVRIRQIPHAVHEGNAGDEGHYCADDYIAQAVTEAKMPFGDTYERHQQRIAYAAHDLGHISAAHKYQEDI